MVDPKVQQIMRLIKELNIQPLTVGQRVLAIHPKTKGLRTGSLLTTDIRSYHAQFDRTELGTMIITDQQLIPISGCMDSHQNHN